MQNKQSTRNETLRKYMTFLLRSTKQHAVDDTLFLSNTEALACLSSLSSSCRLKLFLLKTFLLL